MLTKFPRRYFLSFFILLFPLFMMAQTKITGHVLSSDGQPAAGISVLVKGADAGTSTKADGSFFLAAKSGDVLLLSGVGFAEVEYKVSNSRSWNGSTHNKHTISIEFYEERKGATHCR
jgi:hypothetical protein